MRQLVYEKENSEFKPVKLRLKIDLVSYPARTEGLGKYVSPRIYICVAMSRSFDNNIYSMSASSRYIGVALERVTNENENTDIR